MVGGVEGCVVGEGKGANLSPPWSSASGNVVSPRFVKDVFESTRGDKALVFDKTDLYFKRARATYSRCGER